jgi:hypothetical protein
MLCQRFPGFFANTPAPSRVAHAVAMDSSFEKWVNQRAFARRAQSMHATIDISMPQRSCRVSQWMPIRLRNMMLYVLFDSHKETDTHQGKVNSQRLLIAIDPAPTPTSQTLHAFRFH